MNCIVMFKITTEYAVLMVANDVQSKSTLESECGRAGTEEPKTFILTTKKFPLYGRHVYEKVMSQSDCFYLHVWLTTNCYNTGFPNLILDY